MDDRPVGVFDSGVGGISVLRELVRTLPGEDFVYYGDCSNAPYGTRTEEEILRLTETAVAWLMQKGIKALVIACNTATSAAAGPLRETLPIPVIGMEPALKPAAHMLSGGKALVIATPATIRQKKFQNLYHLFGQDALLLPLKGLMEFAERGELDSPALDAFLQNALAPFANEKIDVAVLGCTHYPFLRKAIQRALPTALLIDGNAGTARQLARVLAQNDLLTLREEGHVTLFSSGGEDTIMRMRRLMQVNLDEGE